MQNRAVYGTRRLKKVLEKQGDSASRRHHLHRDARRLVVFGGGDRPLFTASRGLVDGRTHENQAGQRRTDYGDLESKPKKACSGTPTEAVNTPLTAIATPQVTRHPAKHDTGNFLT